ncbi:MAG: hypothetical protein AVDCRST_MAG43-1502 [uncultured Thermomicrobiales bacterium]|uniref:Uncharacterized protein n=1 Tax=uncultured Thermomicrobiales bacterium TaxID=1645740 RepID=A0A6J4UTZ6_9BACT|nr:MAG: hypothetical protein AVDCRST_MAG43-1502 [uncultured Thermomicrobiales bacterium]
MVRPRTCSGYVRSRHDIGCDRAGLGLRSRIAMLASIVRHSARAGKVAHQRGAKA